MDYVLPVALISAEILGFIISDIIFLGFDFTSAGSNIVDSGDLVFHFKGLRIVLTPVLFRHLPETVIDLLYVSILIKAHVLQGFLTGHVLKLLSCLIRRTFCLGYCFVVVFADHSPELVTAEYSYALDKAQAVIVDKGDRLKSALLKIVEKHFLAPEDVLLVKLRILSEVYCHYLTRVSHSHVSGMHHGRSVIVSCNFALQYNKDDVIVLPVLYINLFRIKYFVHLTPVLQAFDRKTHYIHRSGLDIG